MKQEKQFGKSALLAGLCLAAASLGGCGGTSTGNGVIQLDYQSYNQLAFLEKLLWTPAYATVSNVSFCFKRIRFKAQDVASADPANDADNQDFAIGQVTLSPSGGTLGTVTLPFGTYRRIEIDLTDNCGTGKSVSVTNSNPGGPFTTNATITVKFEGTFNASSSNERVVLGIQNMITALDTAASGSDIKVKLEAVSGSM